MMKKVPLKLTSGRKITLPEDVCEKLGIKIGDHVVLELSEREATLKPFEDYEAVNNDVEG